MFSSTQLQLWVLLGRVPGRFIEVGDRVEGPGMEAEVLEVEGNRASQVRLRVISKPPHGGNQSIIEL